MSSSATPQNNTAAPPTTQPAAAVQEKPFIIKDGVKIEIDLEKTCPALKDKYNKCFMSWYNDKFLKGEPGKEICKEEFEDYRACMMLAVRNKKLDYLLDKDFVKEVQQENWSVPNKSEKK